MSGEHGLQSFNDVLCSEPTNAYDLRILGEIIHNQEEMLSSEVENVCSHFLPRPQGKIMWQKWLFNVSWSVLGTR